METLGYEMIRRRLPSPQIIAAFSLGLLLAVAGVSRAGSIPPPSLEEIVAAALAHNPGLAASRADVETARRGREVSQTLGLPTVSLAGQYQYLPTPGIVSPPGIIPSFVITPEISRPGHDREVAGVIFSLPLYTGGRIPLQIRIAELGTLVAEHRLGGTVQNLIFNASSLYYTALRLDATIVATQQSVASLESARQRVREFVTAGKAPQLDLLRVEARLATVSQDLIRVQNAKTTTLASINNLMGSPVETPVQLAGSLPGSPAAPPPFLQDVPALTQRALQHRPDYLAVRVQLTQQQERVKLARAQLLPQVDLSVGYGVQGGENATTQGAGRVMLGVTVPLVDETLRAKVRQEVAALTALQQRVDQLRLGVGLDVENAVVAIRDAVARIQAAEAGLAQAREALRDEELALQLGKAIVTDVLQAQADLLRAEELHDEGLADYQIAQVQLRHALGMLEAPHKTAVAR